MRRTGTGTDTGTGPVPAMPHAPDRSRLQVKRWPSLVCTVALVVAAPCSASAQQDVHAGHRGMAMEGGWRMVPMDPNMPMLPGLEDAVPVVGPFMPGMGMDPDMLPEARPSELVALEDLDTLDVSVSMVRRTIAGHEMIMFGYNGQYPGPLIQAPKDATVIVRVTNEIEMPTTIHWHGVRLDNRFDGVPGVTQEAIERGESFTYEVHVPDAGMYWYHPHVREDVQQDLGLFGNLLVTSPDPDYYGPAHREEVFVLDDMLIDDQGALPWGDRAPTHALMGRFGNVMMVNGQTDYRLTAKRGEVVRFYLTNVANSRTFNVTFGGAKVKIVASDVSRFEREQWVGSVVIAPAERYVVDVRFDHPGEIAIANTIQAINHFRGEFYPQVDTLSIVSVSNEQAAERTSSPSGPGSARRSTTSWRRPSASRTFRNRSSSPWRRIRCTCHPWNGTTPCP